MKTKKKGRQNTNITFQFFYFLRKFFDRKCWPNVWHSCTPTH
jgi:hypothetical protein